LNKFGKQLKTGVFLAYPLFANHERFKQRLVIFKQIRIMCQRFCIYDNPIPFIVVILKVLSSPSPLSPS